MEHDLFISKVEPLVDFLKSLLSKQVVDNVSLKNQKATIVIRTGLNGFYEEHLTEIMQNRSFSVIIGESTDVSTKKILAVGVIFCNDGLSVQIDILDLIECPDSSAKSIFEELKKCIIKTQKLPPANSKAFCSDTTNSMMGAHKSVSSMIRQEFPWVVILKCSCHMAHLVASYPCKKLPKSMEDICRSIYGHFTHSGKRQHPFIEFQISIKLTCTGFSRLDRSGGFQSKLLLTRYWSSGIL